MNRNNLVMQNEENAFDDETMSSRETITAIIILIILTFVYSGCSGGGSHSGATAAPEGTSANIIEGVFVDSPIEGLNYQTETHSGITDGDGGFVCYEDEMITFMIGDLVLGQAPACELMSPLDFLDDSSEPYGVTNPMVTNMGRFLQSLDADGNPDNGITITEQVRNEISGRLVDFNQSVENFGKDPDVVSCFDLMNSLGVPHDGQMWNLCPAVQAQDHMNTYMCRYGYDTAGSGSSGEVGGNSGYNMMGGL